MDIINLGKPQSSPPKKYSQPLVTVMRGTPYIKSYKILKDHRHVLCENTDNSIHLIDLALLKQIPLEEHKSLQELANAFNSKLQASKGSEGWCSVDIKLGSLSITFDANSWLKATGPLRSLFAGEREGASVINYGSNLANALFGSVVIDKLEETVPLIKGLMNQEQLNEYIKSNNIVHEGINMKRIGKFTVVVNDKEKSASAPCEDIKQIKNDIPKWIMDKLYNSPFTEDNKKINFTIIPVQKFFNGIRLKPYSLTGSVDAQLKAVIEALEPELLKVSKKIGRVSLEIEGKELSPLLPLECVYLDPKIRSTGQVIIQYRVYPSSN